MPGLRMERTEQGPLRLKAELVGYLSRLEKPEGGFSFAPTAPPCIKDTYYAALSFAMLGEKDRPGRTTIQWLKEEPFHIETPLSTVACRVRLHRMLKIPLPVHWLNERLKQEVRKDLNPRRLTCLKELSQVVYGCKEVIEQAVEVTDIYPHPWDTTETLYYKATITEEQHDQWRNRVALWLRECRNGDGGYGCKPGTTSFLEHIYWAMRLMEKAGIELSQQEHENTCQFVRNCQSRRGGFGRAPEGVPFIDSTYHALWVLNYLQSHQ